MERFVALLAHPAGQRRTLARAKALYGAGSLARTLDDASRSLALLQEALAICRERGDREYEGYVLQRHWPTLIAMDDVSGGMAAATEALTIARERQDHFLMCAAFHCLGTTAALQGRVEEGIALMLESDQAGRKAGDWWLRSVNLTNLGGAYVALGDLDQAERHLRESHRLIAELGSKRDMPSILLSLAEIARCSKPDTAYALVMAADLAIQQCDDEHALEMLREAMRLLDEIGTRSDLFRILEMMAAIANRASDMPRVARYLGGAEATLESRDLSWSSEATSDGAHLHDAALSALGEEAFQAQWSMAKVVGLDAIIAEALAWQPVALDIKGTSSPREPAHGLTARELEVLRLMADGLTDQAIAAALFISRRTVTSHTGSIFSKLNLTSRTAAVAYAIRSGLA
jgi:DNA-binding CsgD family transcriptional regulator